MKVFFTEKKKTLSTVAKAILLLGFEKIKLTSLCLVNSPMYINYKIIIMTASLTCPATMLCSGKNIEFNE